MGSEIVFWLFLTFLFGAMMLFLMFGYRSTEERRAREQQQRKAEEMRAAHSVAMMPRFFANSEVLKSPSVTPAFDDALLADLESYVRAEQVLAAQFVNEPSVDSLYRQPRPTTFVN